MKWLAGRIPLFVVVVMALIPVLLGGVLFLNDRSAEVQPQAAVAAPKAAAPDAEMPPATPQPAAPPARANTAPQAPAAEPADAQVGAVGADAHAETVQHARAGQPGRPEALQVASTSAPGQTAQAQSGEGRAATYVPDVSFTLRTDVAEGKLVFVGVGGEIDGLVNPQLHVEPNSVVQITLVNGDGAQHDWAVPDLDAKTDLITGQGSSSTTVFRVGEDGEHTYLCTVPGHQAAGMEGALHVGQGDVSGADEVLPSIVRDPADVPAPIGQRGPTTHDLTLTTTEVEARLADGTPYTFWTFDDTVPGPMLRVRVGDTVNLTLENAEDSIMIHSIDLHAVTGPGGGAAVTQIQPGSGATFTFKALNPGLYVYHCATPMVAHHITSGMYGLILVEPEGGLPPVDREFYIMQGELYTHQAFGQRGRAEFDVQRLLDEQPEYFVFNGAVGALTEEYPLQASVGETVRIFFGVGGPNAVSSFHVIGEIFDRVYDQASLTAAPLTDVQTTLVPAGGAAMVEFELDVPGRYTLVDHSLSRAERGLVGFLNVTGKDNSGVFQGTATAGSGH
jgi:nitrite reductase (NO-forming)